MKTYTTFLRSRARGRASTISALALGALALLVDTPEAHASLQECGGVFVSADANCEYRKTEECMTECTTAAVETACVAKVYTNCESGCTATSTTSCESSCAEVCTSDCTAQVAMPQPKNCMGLCVSECQHTCDNGDGRRKSCCGHNCNAKCEATCKGKEAPPTAPAECTPTCTTACSGSCTAQANVECQVACQTDVYTECETQLVETCKTECKDAGGAIFCDGQFINAGNAKSCSAELKSKLNFDVDVDVDVKARFNKAKASCSLSDVGRSGGSAMSVVCFGMLASAFGLRWRKRLASRRKG